MHMSYLGPEHLKALVNNIGYLKGKYTKGSFIIKSKVVKAIIIFYYIYAMDNDKRESVSGLVPIISGTLLTCSSNTQRAFMLSNIDS